ncbi:MAG TPA: hypothetical protein VKV95_12340 [Terriglobia bacterium]|nr:hypothetical protein [Terriglobia bacterium]
MDLATLVKKYLELSGGFDRPLHLSRLGLSKPEIEKLFSQWDEDYQISRYMFLSREKDETLSSKSESERVFLVNGFECSHVTFNQNIQTLL